MDVLVIIAHPCNDSFTFAMARSAMAGLKAAGHRVDVIDLYADEFRATMSLDERNAYESGDPIIDPQVRDYANRVERAGVLVFVYPTWWSGLPAILKGWLERVMVPGVAFEIDRLSGKVRPRLEGVAHIIGISTYGSPRSFVRFVNDNGRRVLTRSLRLSCGVRTKRTWHALYGIDSSSQEQRLDFLNRVEHEMSSV